MRGVALGEQVGVAAVGARPPCAETHRSTVHHSARRVPAPFRLAITGTPTENLMEL